MRTLFIGGTKRGYLTIKSLLTAGVDLVGIISLRQDPHETDRFELPIRELAESNGIPIFETKWLKEKDYQTIIRDELKPEIAFVVGCRILIPKVIYSIPERGTLAVHDSLLPEYRGFAPLNWSIINGEKQTGVTLFFLSDLMDGGDIAGQKKVKISLQDTAPSVYENICNATTEVIEEYINCLKLGTESRTSQDYSVGSFTCSRTPMDGEIDWSCPSLKIYNLIRGLTKPYPGAFTYIEGRKLIVWSARFVDQPDNFVGRIPGRVIKIDAAAGTAEVLTGDGSIVLSEVQWADETEPKRAAEAIKSIKLRLGLQTAELFERIKHLEGQLSHKST